MTDEPRYCSVCSEQLGEVMYSLCGNHHLLSEFKAVWGYIIDVGDMYGNWDTPDYFIVPVKSWHDTKIVYTTEKGCCYFREMPEADDENWCRICKDVMEPRVGPLRKLGE
jgi:hypothetical protein